MQGDKSAALVLKLRTCISDVKAAHWLSACQDGLSLHNQQADNSLAFTYVGQRLEGPTITVL